MRRRPNQNRFSSLPPPLPRLVSYPIYRARLCAGLRSFGWVVSPLQTVSNLAVAIGVIRCRSFTAFRPNRIRDAATWVAAFQKGRRYLDGEYGSYYRIYCSTYWCTIHVRSGTVSVIVLRQRAIGKGLVKVSCDKGVRL